MICNSLPVATDGDRTKRTNDYYNSPIKSSVYPALPCDP